MMIRGRHRGLPYALDRAITLPSDRKEDGEARYRDEIEPYGKQKKDVAKS